MTQVAVMYLLYGTLIQIPNSLSDLSMPLHKNHELLIHKLAIFTTERNSYSQGSCNFLKFVCWGVLSYKFLQMTVFGVK